MATSTMDDIPGVGSREETYSPVPGALPSDVTWDPEDIVAFTDRLGKESDDEGMGCRFRQVGVQIPCLCVGKWY